jgi:hypothetical protein
MTPFQAKRAGKMKRAFPIPSIEWWNCLIPLRENNGVYEKKNGDMKRAYTALSLCLLFIACLGEKGSGPHSSTSVTTGNPTGIIFNFKWNSAPVSLDGKLEIFASYQIPVPGFSPNPLLGIDFSGAKNAVVDAKSIESIPDSLWPESSMVGDSILEFNAVVSSDSLGLIVKGLRYRKTDSAFFDSGTRLAIVDSKAELTAELTGLTDYVGEMNRDQMSPAWYFHLFIYGTGFTTKGKDGVFTIPRLPKGQHEAFWILLPSESGHASRSDSVPLIKLRDGLDSELDSLHVGPIQRMIELPDSLKLK